VSGALGFWTCCKLYGVERRGGFLAAAQHPTGYDSFAEMSRFRKRPTKSAAARLHSRVVASTVEFLDSIRAGGRRVVATRKMAGP